MFSKDITTSDAFREMPTSSQALYFHLGMEADDDGFLDSYKGLMRSVGAKDDDLKLLVAKRFILPRDGGIIVIKHWLINNTIRKDRYNPTKHIEAKNGLFLKENGAYTEDETLGLPVGNHLAPQKRIEEDRKEQITADAEYEIKAEPEPEPRTKKYPHKKEVLSLWKKPREVWERNPQICLSAENLYFEKGIDRVKAALEFWYEHKDEPYCPDCSNPYKLDLNWDGLISFKKKNNL